MSGTTRRKVVKTKNLPETLSGMPETSVQEVKEESNPFTVKDWRMLGYAWSGFALRIVFILGALFSAFQYLQALEEKRVERSLAMLELWERPEYQQAQAALKRRLSDLNTRYASLLGSNPGPKEYEIYHERVGMEAMSESGGVLPLSEFREHFDKVVYFLNRLSFCVEGRLCSQEVSDEVFLDFARSFWTYFGGYIEAERKRGATNFAAPLEAYVTADR